MRTQRCSIQSVTRQDEAGPCWMRELTSKAEGWKEAAEWKEEQQRTERKKIPGGRREIGSTRGAGAGDEAITRPLDASHRPSLNQWGVDAAVDCIAFEQRPMAEK